MDIFGLITSSEIGQDLTTVKTMWQPVDWSQIRAAIRVLGIDQHISIEAATFFGTSHHFCQFEESKILYLVLFSCGRVKDKRQDKEVKDNLMSDEPSEALIGVESFGKRVEIQMEDGLLV